MGVYTDLMLFSVNLTLTYSNLIENKLSSSASLIAEDLLLGGTT